MVDGGSSDGTAAVAAAAGARVILADHRGYGRACAAGAAAASPECGIIVFMDGDGADRGDLMVGLVEPIRRGDCDFVIASRTRGEREPRIDELAPASRRISRGARHAARSTAYVTLTCAPIAQSAATASRGSACAR